MSESPRNPAAETPSILDDKIDELEDLLEKRQRDYPDIRFEDNIPVLEDLVEYHDPDLDPDLFDPPPELDSDFIEESVHHAMDNLDSKITEELEGLVSILKDSIKDTVLTEIRQQLETEYKGLAGHNDKPSPESD